MSKTAREYIKNISQLGEANSNSQTNTSPSKMRYSFPKQKRFQQAKPACCHNFYELPTMRDTRSYSMGVSKREDIKSKINVQQPGPNSYVLTQSLLNNNKGQTFAKGRENIMFNSPFLQSTFKVPGPGQYSDKTQLIKRANSSYTFRMRTPLPNEFKDQKQYPGPGLYKTEGINSTGRTVSSKYRNNHVAKIAPITVNKMLVKNKIDNFNPGPGLYKTQNIGSISSSFQNITKFKNTKYGKFGSQKKCQPLLENKEKIPGPGQYKLPSDFANY